MSKPKIEHNLNQYGMHNISYKNVFDIYKLSTSNDCYVKVYCDISDLESVEADIKRHVDDVDSTHCVVGGTDQAYVIEGDVHNHFDTWEEALLFSLDPDGTLTSLHGNENNYIITCSSRPDDINNGSNTDRTQHRCKTVSEVLQHLPSQSYIHKLEGLFTEQEKSDLLKLSLLIQQKLGKPSESRVVEL